MLRLPYAQSYLDPSKRAQRAEDGERRDRAASKGITAAAMENGSAPDTDSDLDSKPLLSSSSSEDGGAGGADAAPVSVVAVFRKIWPMAIGVFMVFFGTFILFPGVMDQIPYKGDSPSGMNFPVLATAGWWNTIMLALFNVFDTVGRTLPARIQCLPAWALLPFAVLRLGLIPLFLGCAHSWTSGFSDIAAVLFMIVFATTNGYTASLCFMYAPPRVPDREKETVGFLMSLFLNVGIVLGSQAALGFSNN